MIEYKDIKDIDGWVDPKVLPVVRLISEEQNQKGIFGNIAEIGVHHGKFFVFIASLLKDEEFSYAIDIFENQVENKTRSGNGNLIIFSSNINKLLPASTKLIIVKENSMNINLEFLNHKMKTRLMSIDGGHSYEETINDLRISDAVCHDDGIIMVDDYQSSGWDGVYFATVDYLLKETLVPIAMGGNKLFLKKKNSKFNFNLSSISKNKYLSLYKCENSIKKSTHILDKYPNVIIF